MADAQLLRGELERKPGGVEVKNLALATTELRLREVAVGVDGRGPLQVVEHIPPRHRGDGGHHRGRRGGLGDHAGRTGGQGLPHQGDPVGDAVHQHRGAGAAGEVHVVGDERPVAEREVQNYHVDRAGGEAGDEFAHRRGREDHLEARVLTGGLDAQPHRLMVVGDPDTYGLVAPVGRYVGLGHGVFIFRRRFCC